MILRRPTSTLFPYTTLFRSMQIAQQLHDRFAVRRVEVSGRLIRQQDKRLAPERARHGHALLLTARKLGRSEEHTSELQSLRHLVCRLLLEKKKTPHPMSAAR